MTLENWVKNVWLEKRASNAEEIGRFGQVSQGEADHCGTMAVQVRKDVETWIRKNHRAKLK